MAKYGIKDTKNGYETTVDSEPQIADLCINFMAAEPKVGDTFTITKIEG